MRVPTNSPLTSLVESLGRFRRDQQGAIERAASGRRINRPSDDPIGSARAAVLRGQLDGLRSTMAAATLARSELAAADASLAAMGDRIQEALDRGTQGATDLLNPTQRNVLAAEIRQAADDLLAEGNRAAGGYTLFGGGQTLQAAFAAAPDRSFTYLGDTTTRTVDVDGQTISLNVPGDRILTGPQNAGAALEALALAVELGDVTATKAALVDVESLRQQVVTGRAEVGRSLARLDQSQTEVLRRTESLVEDLSGVEDADLVEVATEISRLGQQIEATLGASRMSQTGTLFDVLA